MSIIDDLQRSYEQYYGSLSTDSFSRQQKYAESKVTLAEENLPVTLAPNPTEIEFGSIQRKIKDFYGKDNSLCFPSIGTPPYAEFSELNKDNKSGKFDTITMFMDICNSTKLGLMHSPEEVFLIKNAFIKSAIEIINGFNGSIHRIMGDAVMAFFCDPNTTKEQNAIDSINCASFLMFFVEKALKPFLETNGFVGLGIRVGLDFAPKEKVLWKKYGYTGSSEITATSFHVDVASKLQHQAGKNNIALGQSLVGLLDFPSDLLLVKEKQSGKERIQERYIIPNYEINGEKMNYRKWILSWEKYLKYSPFFHCLDKEIIPDGGYNKINLLIAISDQEDGAYHMNYKSSSSILHKNKWLKFTFPLLSITFPINIRCSVENHGFEAETADKESENNELSHHIDYQINNIQDLQTFNHLESTRYKGLHYFNIKIRAGWQNEIKYKGRAGIYIY